MITDHHWTSDQPLLENITNHPISTYIICANRTSSETDDMIYYVSGVVVTIFGILSNSLALYVLRSGDKPSFVFFYNQSLVDLLCNCSLVVMQLSVHFLRRRTRPNDIPSWLFCKLIYSQYTTAATLALSSYSLVLFSLDCMVAVTYPVWYKRVSSRKRKIRSIKLLWIVVFTVTAPFMYTTNGLDTSTGKCVFWAMFRSNLHRTVHIIVYHGLLYIVPFLSMCTCYVIITLKLSKSNTASLSNKTKCIVRTALRVMLAYSVCVMPSTFMFIAKMLGAKICEKTLLYSMLLLMLILNSAVNPVIYYFQFEGSYQI